MPAPDGPVAYAGEPGAFAEDYGNMPAIGLAAKNLHVDLFEGDAGDNRDAVIPLLSVERDVLISQAPEPL